MFSCKISYIYRVFQKNWIGDFQIKKGYKSTLKTSTFLESVEPRLCDGSSKNCEY